jgi:hypothetical protein
MKQKKYYQYRDKDSGGCKLNIEANNVKQAEQKIRDLKFDPKDFTLVKTFTLKD